MIDTKALREKILDIAIRGKLVPQDPNDEPASVLLERIRAQKQQMVKEGKLKAKDIKNDTIIFKGEDNLHYEQFRDGTVKCIEDEIPFEIPESWEWCRLSMVGTTNIGLTYKPTEVKESGTIVFRSCNIKNGKINFTDLVRVQADIRENQYIYENDILMCARNGSRSLVGKCAIIQNLTEVASFGAFMAVFRSICNQYIYYYFNTYLFRSTFDNDDSKQINQVTQAILRDALIPLPPFAEQTRIVTKLHEILSLVDFVNDGTNQIETMIANAKSKILDLAIRGKLVPQDPNDELASVLLERIKAEKEELIKQGKIKRDKKESVIFKGEDNSYYEKIGNQVTCIDSEIPFEIPENWAWSRLSSFTEIVMGSSPKGENICADSSFTEFHQGKIYFSKQYINCSMQYTKNISKLASKNSVLLCVRAPVGEVNITNRDICIGRGLSSILPLDDIDSIFLFYWLKTFKKEFTNQSTGSTFSAITSDIVKNILLPVPPLNEQNKITKTITYMFAYLEHIEASLN